MDGHLLQLIYLPYIHRTCHVVVFLKTVYVRVLKISLMRNITLVMSLSLISSKKQVVRWYKAHVLAFSGPSCPVRFGFKAVNFNMVQKQVNSSLPQCFQPNCSARYIQSNIIILSMFPSFQYLALVSIVKVEQDAISVPWEI